MSPLRTFPTAKAAGPNLQDVATLIKDDKVKNIIILVGAGISTSAGIPDFRSPNTGLYANLEQYNLPYPEAIFDLQYFYTRPEAFFTLAKEIYPGNYLPTLTHYFIVLLHRKGLLLSTWSQNVDTLERIAGLPADSLIEAHGSFATAHCLTCKQLYQAEELRSRIAKGEILRCEKPKCKGKSRNLIKSDIVFFGESLPAVFYKRLGDFAKCDLLITIGTSLQVQPFASLIDRVNDSCPRLLINLESVGEMDEFDAKGGMFGRYRENGFDFEGTTRGGKEYARDVRWLGQADTGIRELARTLDWEKELDELFTTGRGALSARHLQTKDITPPFAPDNKRSAEEEAEKIAQAIRKQVDEGVDDHEAKEAPVTGESKVDELASHIKNLNVREEVAPEATITVDSFTRPVGEEKKAAL